VTRLAAAFAIVTACIPLSPLPVAASQAPPAAADQTTLHWIAQEVEIAGVLDTLERSSHDGPLVFRDISVVDVINARVVAHQSVFVRDGKIVWIGDAASLPDPTGALVVDGRGRYLSPGLTDMHVHTQSLAEQVLRLAVGETSIRDMDGFPWMLELRRAIESGRLLAPTPYLAGTIITSYPLAGYSVVVNSADEARATVRKETACGYDFIKVHNILQQGLFDAVANEAQLAGMDLVGHIPHDISIDHALHIGHMRTVEHLKGFLIDETLTVSNEDYAKAIAGVEYWQTPTLYTYLHYLHGEAARAQLARPEMQYISAARRADWVAYANTASPRDDHLLDLLVTAQHAAINRLLPLSTRWLAGSDAAQYRYNIAGYALLDELRLMRQFGIPTADVLRAATSEPAAAMRRNDFGQVKHGLRADLVLLGSDPTQDLGAYYHNQGVVVRGRWLDRAALDVALGRLAQVEAEPDFAVSDASIRALLREVSRLAADHIALDQKHLVSAVASLRGLGRLDAAAKLEAVGTALGQGACAEITPGSDQD
jgi:Amidohydrolase family